MSGWRCLPAGNEAHVYPVGDLIGHEPIDCTCGPQQEVVKRDDGSVGWIVIHNSLDGRGMAE